MSLSLSLPEWPGMARNDPLTEHKWSIRSRSAVDSAQWDWGITPGVLIPTYSYYFLTQFGSFLFIQVCTFIEKIQCPTENKKIWPFDEEEWVQISNILHLSTFGSRFAKVSLGHKSLLLFFFFHNSLIIHDIIHEIGFKYFYLYFFTIYYH